MGGKGRNRLVKMQDLDTNHDFGYVYTAGSVGIDAAGSIEWAVKAHSKSIPELLSG